MSDLGRKNARTATVLFSVVAGMVGLAYASVPLYQWICQVTGLAGTPSTENVVASDTILDETINVRFDSNVSPALPWQFEPLQREVTVRLGEESLAFYRATNTSDKPIVGTSTFNVSPFKAGPFFIKMECFCFTEQVLLPGESIEMPVSFYVDPEIIEEANTKEVRAITLSYTFYQAKDQAKVSELKSTDASQDNGG